MTSAVFYVSIFLITGLLAEYSTKLEDFLIEEKIKKYLFIIFIISIPAFFSGIRHGIGTDYNSYADIFTAINTGVGNNPTEIGYTLLNYIVGQLGGNVQIVFFIMSFFTILFVYLFLYEYRSNLSIGIGLLIFLIMFYNMSYNIVRQVFAVAISLYSFKFIDKQEPVKFISLIISGMTFHAGTIVVFPLYIVYNSFSYKRKMFRIAVYIAFILAITNYQMVVEFVSLQILDTEKYLYLTEQTATNLTAGAVMLYAPHILIGLIFYDSLANRNKSFKFFFFLLIIAYLIGLLPAFGAPVVLKRIGSYFTVANVWVVPYYYQSFKNKENLFWIVPLLILYTLLTWYVMYVIGGDSSTIPYITIFNS